MVGVAISVNIVSKLIVSVEKVNTSLGDVVKSSSIQAVNIHARHVNRIYRGKYLVFIYYTYVIPPFLLCRTTTYDISSTAVL